MKLFLVLEHRFYESSNGAVYSERVVNNKFLQRYLNVFEEVIVCGRFSEDGSLNNEKLRVDGENISFIKLPDFKGAIGAIKNYNSVKKIINKEVRRADAVLLRAPSPISLMAYSQVKNKKKPLAAEVVVNPRTSFEPNNKYDLINKLQQKIMVNHTKKLCLQANGVSYVTENILQQEYPSTARLSGQNEEYFEAYYSTINLSKEDYLDENLDRDNNDIFTIYHVGYMDRKIKGHVTVMDTLKILLNEGYEAQVKFIGSGRLIEEFKKYAQKLKIEKNVIFLGNFDDYSDIQKELRSADLFLFPTMSEGLPRVLIEAMANRITCISSPVDGIPELLNEEFLAPFDAPDILAEKVAYFIDNPKKREEEAQKNYIKSKEYSEEKLTLRRNDFYLKLYKVAYSYSK